MIDDKYYNVNTQDIEEALFIVNSLYCYNNIEYIDILDEYENDKNQPNNYKGVKCCCPINEDKNGI